MVPMLAAKPSPQGGDARRAVKQAVKAASGESRMFHNVGRWDTVAERALSQQA
jgi:hypothetical protein